MYIEVIVHIGITHASGWFSADTPTLNLFAQHGSVMFLSCVVKTIYFIYLFFIAKICCAL